MSPFKLHIGSRLKAEGWKTFDIIPGPEVDYVGNCSDLSQFGDGTVDTLYASHVLEHLSYQGPLQAAFKEWARVVAPGGTAMIAVPDCEALCRLFIDPKLTFDERFYVMRIMFGGQVNEHDFHTMGFSFEFLSQYLAHHGFTDIRRVDSFGLFNDTSNLKLNGVLVSLNVVAVRSAAAAPRAAAPVTSFLRKR